MELLVFIVSLFSLLIFGIPIAMVLVLCAIILMSFMGQWDPLIIGQNMVNGVDNFSLMAVPFFMLAGEIMARGGLSKLIVDFSSVLLGRIKGGLGYVAILASMVFAGLSGSAVADAAALGSILVPIMKNRGYKVERATGLIMASALVAVIIPPSIPMILLGSTTGISISKLFMSGIVPGIIMGLALMVTWFMIAKKDGYNDVEKYSAKEAMQIIVKSLPALFMPVLIIGGIRLGVFTPTEAGVFAVVYALLISVFLYRNLKLKDLLNVFVDAAQKTAIVMFVVAGATTVAWLITIAQLPMQLADFFGGFMNKPLLLLLVINLFLFLLGMVMDLTPALLIFGPVLFPVIQQAGIDPYFFALIMILNLTIGLITPPVGTILYLGCSVGKITFPQMIRGVLPFLLTEVFVLLIYIFFPDIVLAPVNWLHS